MSLALGQDDPAEIRSVRVDPRLNVLRHLRGRPTVKRDAVAHQRAAARGGRIVAAGGAPSAGVEHVEAPGRIAGTGRTAAAFPRRSHYRPFTPWQQASMKVHD